MDTLRTQIIAEARTWLGTPWRHQGRTTRGMDCIGLLVAVGKRLNLIQYDVKGYPRQANRHEMVGYFQNVLTEIPVPQRQPGSILLFRDGLYTCHTGIIGDSVNGHTLIHGYFVRGKVVEEPLNPEWISKITHCFEFPGI